jgi:hypothetical protein
MEPQLSTSDRVSQPRSAYQSSFAHLGTVLLLCAVALSIWSSNSFSQSTDLELNIEPLTSIDKQFMSDQRQRVEQLANRLGRNVSGKEDRDIDTLQRIIDDRLIASDDTLNLQAIGVVLGDLLADRLDMVWVVYRDRKGRSRALRYRETDVYLFPITMISRRQQAGSNRSVRSVYDEAVKTTLPRIPGGKWLL